MKFLISPKTVPSSVPIILSFDNGDTITNSYDIANTFNKYFVSIAETTKKSYNIHINESSSILINALINITENIRKALDDGNIVCGVYVDLQKAFDYCKPPDTVSKIESLWDSWSFK